jgi:hypothetical protein
MCPATSASLSRSWLRIALRLMTDHRYHQFCGGSCSSFVPHIIASLAGDLVIRPLALRAITNRPRAPIGFGPFCVC